MYYVIGIIMIVAGIIINIIINRRRFYRRGPGGLQHFETYGGSVFTTWIEKLGKLIAIALILLGLFSIVTGSYVKADKDRRMQKVESTKGT